MLLLHRTNDYPFHTTVMLLFWIGDNAGCTPTASPMLAYIVVNENSLDLQYIHVHYKKHIYQRAETQF